MEILDEKEMQNLSFPDFDIEKIELDLEKKKLLKKLEKKLLNFKQAFRSFS